jgi:hypothetical protein
MDIVFRIGIVTGLKFWAVSDINAGDLRAFADLEMQQSPIRREDAQGGFIGSQVFPSRSSHDNARSSPARTRSSMSRCGSRNVRGINPADCGFAVPAPVKSRASGGTVSLSGFLFILVDLTEYTAILVRTRWFQATTECLSTYLACQSVKPVFFLTSLNDF